MKKTTLLAAMAAASAITASTGAFAQTKPIETVPQHREMDPAKRVPPAPVASATEPEGAQPQRHHAHDQPSSDERTPRAWDEDNLGGFFVGAKGGKGWVYDDVDQSARELNAGYRWQAGAATLVGIEVASGRLSGTTEGRVRYGEVDYGSIGVNARFSFGAGSPVHGLVRAGYWAADGDDYGMDVDGGYVGLGLGVDFSRHFNMSLVYTNYVYFNEYYWSDGDLYYDASRADTLMLGAEVRF